MQVVIRVIVLIAAIHISRTGRAEPSTTTMTASASTAPTSSTSTTLNLSSPAAAARAMRTAIRRGDEAALREILSPFVVDPTDPQAVRDPRVQLSDAQAGIIFAGKRIADLMNARFGDSGDRLAGGAGVLSPNLLDSALADVTDNQFHRVSDDLATLPLPGDPQGRITFRRVDRIASGGATSAPATEIWHVDMSSDNTPLVSTQPTSQPDSSTSDPSEDLLARAAFMRRLAIGLNEAADDIEQGRRRTLDDARAAIVDKFHSTIAHSIHPPTLPTTQPATASSGAIRDPSTR